jgi:thiamine-phosphate diphosphorylase
VTSSGHSHYSVIVHYLESVAGFVPETQVPALQQLKEVLPALPSPLALADLRDPPPATAAQTLSLVSTARGLLPLLDENQSANPLGWETVAALIHVLADLADQLGAAVRRDKASSVRGLYVIIDPEVTGGRDPLAVAEAAVRGGARMLQLRDKLRDKGESLPLALALQNLCQESGVQLIINDHADIAAVVGSAGLHVGQTDLPVRQARQVLGPDQVVGRSNHEFEELVESQEMGADHLAFGPIYQTGTKGVGRPPQGTERLRQAREITKTPLVAIGGINAGNAAPVVEAGADAICVAAAVGLAPEPEGAAARLVKSIEEAGGRV